MAVPPARNLAKTVISKLHSQRPERRLEFKKQFKDYCNHLFPARQGTPHLLACNTHFFPHYWLGYGFALGIVLAAISSTFVLRAAYVRLNKNRDAMSVEEVNAT